nr:hypothetical protein [Tanacetum cinerariifolium]
QTSSAGASLLLSSGNISSLAVGKYSGSGNFITGAAATVEIPGFAAALAILKPEHLKVDKARSE